VNSPAPDSGPACFAPTRWTLVLRARGDSPEAQRALGELCEAYWQPVFRFLRREGREDDTAREVAQEFFARLLARHGLATVEPARGKFRSFLLGAVKHFLADQRKHAARSKRGGGLVPEPLDGLTTEDAPVPQRADPTATVPDAWFDRQWALAVMERALNAAEAEFVAAGKAEQFVHLQPWLVGDTEALASAEAARRLGMSEGAVKVAVHRLRKRFRELLRAEVAQTVAEGDNVDTELRYLVEALAHGEARQH
jgi:RNA polymerase sigma-70 factor (ECF subfamily)